MTTLATDLTVKEVAERLHMSRGKVRLMVNEGRFPNVYQMDPTKATSPIMIPEKDVEAIEKARLKHRPFVGARKTQP
jgi:DNA-binding transcriptional regulator LsrR (DeoR family)